MFKVIKGFGGQVSARKDEVIDLKDKKLVNELLEAGYIVETNEKAQTNTEIKKENEKLKKELEKLQTENKNLEALLQKSKEDKTPGEVNTDPDAESKE